MKNIGLKKEIAAILGSAQPVKGQPGTYVAERVNECGLKCTYRFNEDMKTELLKRAGQPRKSNSKSRSWEYIQKGLLFLQENQHIIPTLLDINYLMKEQGYSVQAACEVLFKNKKTLPQGFYREHIGYAFTRYTEFRVKANGGSQCSVSRLIDLIPILPKAWLEKSTNN